jgi:hypothetical protein
MDQQPKTILDWHSLRLPLIVLSVASALMLFFAAYDVRPYAFYQIIRWLVCSTSILLAVNAYRWDNKWAPWLFAVTAILFNPIAPIHFARETWAIIDRIAAVVMLIGGFAVKPNGDPIADNRTA